MVEAVGAIKQKRKQQRIATLGNMRVSLAWTQRTLSDFGSMCIGHFVTEAFPPRSDGSTFASMMRYTVNSFQRPCQNL